MKKYYFYIACLLIMLSIFRTKSHAQPPKVVPDTAITDSTELISLSQIVRLSKYLEDKMIAKDYNLVMSAINDLLSEAVQRKKKKGK